MATSDLLFSLILLLLFCFHFGFSSSGAVKSMESIPDLRDSMYKLIDGYPCVRLLNLSGSIGCSNPGRGTVVAPIIRFKSAEELAQKTAVLVSMDEVQDFFARLSNDSRFAKNIGGVLVESGAGTRKKLKGFSPAQKFPQAEFSPYSNISYQWNQIGSGIMWKSYDFPVFLLSESSRLSLQEAAMKNEKTKNGYTAVVAEFELVMQTTKSGTPHSESCLKAGACLPLGGYSVWSSLPPINILSSHQSKPVILSMASMDSASFFHDKSLGADSPISGLISLLAAVDALSHVDGLNNLSKQLVFLVPTGEAWGYLGSRRFLFELDLQSEAVSGLNSSLIETVIEIGSVGKGLNQEVKTFFTHSAGNMLPDVDKGGSGYTDMYRSLVHFLVVAEFVAGCRAILLGGDGSWWHHWIVSSATNRTLDALKQAQNSLKSENVSISSANPSNPGIPPSSLMAFLRQNPLTSGVVLEDFDTAFINKFYSSHLDDLSNVNSSSIVAAASLVARSLFILASDNEDLDSSILGGIKVNVSLVEELMGCLLDCDPGLSCELVKNYISPTKICPSHYAGVVIGEPTPKPNSEYVDDIARFVYNFLADRTAIPEKTASPSCSQDCSNNSEVCIKAETNGKGVCVLSTTRYVPAYSTRLKFDSGYWKVLPPNSSVPMSLVDPVWTESNWNTIGLRVYTVQDVAYDRVLLLGGIAVTILAYLAIVVTRTFITKALKRD